MRITTKDSFQSEQRTRSALPAVLRELCEDGTNGLLRMNCCGFGAAGGAVAVANTSPVMMKIFKSQI